MLPTDQGKRHSPRLNVLGCGRVGQTLSRLWHAKQTFLIQDVLTSSPDSAQAACGVIDAGQAVANLQDMRPADIWMLGVPDAQLDTSVRALTDHASRHPGLITPAPVIFHCSGAQSSRILAPLTALGCRTASAHCILSFATVASALAQFSGTPCAVEGDADACAVLRPAFSAIGARCFDVASDDKLLYHAAAVFATNFLPVLQSVAEDLWQSTGVPPDLIPSLRASLLHNAVANITKLGPQAALTGPAARGDTAAIARQGAAVAEWDAQTGAAYAALSALGLRLGAKGLPVA
jgi:predicted short-subunit dehydrogenase-like oxidoreductase (DUF2520 family)